MRSQPGTLFPIVVLVLALAGLVALSSQGTPLPSLVQEDRGDPLEVAVVVAALCGAGLVLAAVVTFVVHRGLAARRSGTPPLGTLLLRGLPVTTATLAVVSLLVIARTDLGWRGESGGVWRGVLASERPWVPFDMDWWDSPVRAGRGETDPEAPGAGADRDGGASVLVLLASAVLAALAGAAAWRWHTMRSVSVDPAPVDEAEEPGREAVRDAVAGTIDAMLADPDPNTAIRGAYARLLEGLAACRGGRLAHEAPLEHLRRVLGTLQVRPGPVKRLAELFEVARFSTRRLTPLHREQALRALREVAADLGGFPAVPASEPSRPVGTP